MSDPAASLTELTALELRRAIAAGEVSAEQALRAYLDAIDRRDGRVAAYNEVLAERAVEQARAVDARRAAGQDIGPLGGVPLHDLLDQIERQLVVRAMAQADQVKTRAAEILQIKPSALYYKLEKYGLG